MNQELVEDKLSNTLNTIDEMNALILKAVTDEINYDKYKQREELDKHIHQIRMNTIACLIEMRKTDDLSELSTDEQELYYEYESEGEGEDTKVGKTTDGFYFLT